MKLFEAVSRPFARARRSAAERAAPGAISDRVQRAFPPDGLAVSLPFESRVPYSTFPSSTFPLGMCLPNFDFSPLFASYYINFSFPDVEKFDHKTFVERNMTRAALTPWMRLENFAAMGFVESQVSPVEGTIENAPALIEWIIAGLKEGWYAYATGNERHIPGTGARRLGEDFAHPGLIIGFDPRKKTFQWVTYFEVERYNLQFKATEVSAYEAAMALTNQPDLWKKKYAATWQKPKRIRPYPGFKAPFDRTNACVQLRNYLISRASGDRLKDPAVSVMPEEEWLKFNADASYAWGLDSYRMYVWLLRRTIAKKRWIDLRDTRSFWEHKKIMEKNVAFWSAQALPARAAALSASYRSILNWAHTLHLLSVAHNSQRKSRARAEAVLKAAEPWEEIRRSEESILTEILAALAKS